MGTCLSEPESSIASDPDPRTTISNLMSTRYPLYGSVADITVETSGLTHQEVADRAVAAICTSGRPPEMKTTIRALAKEHGFDDCRFARAVQAPHAMRIFFLAANRQPWRDDMVKSRSGQTG